MSAMSVGLPLNVWELSPISSLSLLVVLCVAAKRKRCCRSFAVSGRLPNKKRKRHDAINDLLELDESTFTRMMRMDMALFKELCKRVEPHLHLHWTEHSRKMAILANGSVVTVECILAATIRWLAGGSPWDVAFMFKLSIKTFHDYKWRVVNALNFILKDNINFPVTEVGLKCLAQGFADRNDNICDVVAAVDCCILEMHTPESKKFKDKTKQTNISSRFCRKGHFATTVLAFVDAHMRFLSISITCGASSHDSTHFSASSLGHHLTRPETNGGISPKWIIAADDAFKSLPHCMTPYQKQYLTNEQKNFNYCLSSLRSSVECAFGLWKGKWGVLWRPLRVKQRNIPKLVEVTCRLHNLCVNRKVSSCLDDFVIADDIFWVRTCSDDVRKRYRAKGRPLPQAPRADADVSYADAATVAAILRNVPSAQGMRVLRKEAADRIARRGTMRRMAVAPPKLNRVAAYLDDDDDDASVFQIGDFD